MDPWRVRWGQAFAPPSRWIWTALTTFYVAFFSWYTSFAGPLTGDEIAHYMSQIESRQPSPNPAQPS